MIKIGLSLLMALLVAFLIPLSAAADERFDPFEAMQNPKRLLRGAMLSDEQVAQIRELRRTQMAEDKEIQKKLKTLWDRFDEMFTSGGAIDQAELTSMMEQGQRLQSQSERGKLKVMFQMRELLTPAQLSRVSQAHQRMKTLETQERLIEPTIASE